MAELSSKTRNALPDRVFGLPGRRFPLNNRSHAANAKARASEGVKKGWITSSQKATIDRKANKVLGKKGK
jgi:hypothetical protein